MPRNTTIIMPSLVAGLGESEVLIVSLSGALWSDRLCERQFTTNALEHGSDLRSPDRRKFVVMQPRSTSSVIIKFGTQKCSIVCSTVPHNYLLIMTMTIIYLFK